jgi:hypothetical protein
MSQKSSVRQSVQIVPRVLTSDKPSVEAAGMDAQAATHRPHRKQGAMLGNERVSHFASLAKYAVAFFRMSRSSVTLVSSRYNRLISASLSSPPDGSENFFFHA